MADLLVEGLTNREVAARLHVSERTAEYHVEQLRNKLGVHSRRDIAAWRRSVMPAATVRPATRYVRNGSVNVAFQLFGGGPRDLVVVPGWVSHVDHMWLNPYYSSYLRKLAEGSRLILFDKRGTGLSDRVSVGSVEDRVDDIRAILDALGATRVAVYGVSEGGPLAIQFAATHPDRVSALAIYGSFARMVWAPDYRIGVDRAAWLERAEFTERNWPVVDLERWAPSVATDDGFRQWLAEVRRYGASPGAARELMEVIAAIDVRPALSAIRAPALVMHRSGDATVPIAMGKVIADGIPGSRWVELPGADHLPWTGDVDALVSEIAGLLAATEA